MSHIRAHQIPLHPTRIDYTECVESPRPKALLANIFGSAVPGSAFADADRFLQQRVILYIKVLFFFFAAFTALGTLKTILHALAGGQMAQYAGTSARLTAALGLIPVFLAWDWWYLSRKQCSVRMLHGFESAGTVCGCTMIALATPLLPAVAPAGALQLAVLLTLVIRAAIVPSSLRRTVVVGILSTVGLALMMARRSGELGDVGAATSQYMWFFVAVWGVIFSIATGIVSRVIYGLHKSVRKAMQLGNYTLDKKLGEGGMGVVYLAHHALLRRPTAVKLLPPEKAGEQAVTRFEREVQNTSRLGHPNTVEIYDFGRTPEGVFYYAMEYLEGVNLDELIELEGPQSPARVIHILAQVAHALAEAHEGGLIHRDIKPANIVLCNRGGVADMAKVVDFGLVKDVSGAAELGVTGSNMITGTPLYMPPEIIATPRDIDGRSDLYSLAAVGFFLITGEHVFDGSSAVAICADHLHTQPDRPSDRMADDLPRDLEDVILRGLAKKPDDRFDSAHAFRRALLACRDARSWGLTEAVAWWAQYDNKITEFRAAKQSGMSVGTADTIAIALDERLGA